MDRLLDTISYPIRCHLTHYLLTMRLSQRTRHGRRVTRLLQEAPEVDQVAEVDREVEEVEAEEVDSEVEEVAEEGVVDVDFRG